MLRYFWSDRDNHNPTIKAKTWKKFYGNDKIPEQSPMALCLLFILNKCLVAMVTAVPLNLVTCCAFANLLHVFLWILSRRGCRGNLKNAFVFVQPIQKQGNSKDFYEHWVTKLLFFTHYFQHSSFFRVFFKQNAQNGCCN